MERELEISDENGREGEEKEGNLREGNGNWEERKKKKELGKSTRKKGKNFK